MIRPNTPHHQGKKMLGQNNPMVASNNFFLKKKKKEELPNKNCRSQGDLEDQTVVVLWSYELHAL